MTDEKAPAPANADGVTAGFLAAVVLLLVVLGLGGYWYTTHRAKAPPPSPLLDLGPAAVTTPSGLRWKDFQEGAGPSPQPGQTCHVHYLGRLVDGSTFDGSRKKGDTPFSFRLGKGEVIKGWDEGVASMRVGGVRRLVVPPDLAYGSQGRPGIPADSTLIFDIELKGFE
jgi:hypothetical protein